MLDGSLGFPCYRLFNVPTLSVRNYQPKTPSPNLRLPNSEVYGTTNAGYGTANADAGVGIGMKWGDSEIYKKKTMNLADKAIN